MLVYAHSLRIAHIHSDNATSEYVTPVIGDVVEILTGLIGGLQESGLSGCGCTSQDILGLISETLQVLLPSLFVVFPLTFSLRGVDHPSTAWPCMRFKL